MKFRIIILAVAAWLVASACAPADTVKTTSATVIGQITAMSATEVTVQQNNGSNRTIPVNQIDSIHYDGESALLKTARTAIAAGRYEEALETLDKVKEPDSARPEIKQDIDFYKAFAAGKLALAGSRPIAEAGTALASFISTQPKSYHYLAACELVGDLLVASHKASLAQRYYGELTKVPWPDYQMRAGVAMGRSLLTEGKADEALKAFQAVLDTKATGDAAERLRLAAILGKARCLAESGKTDEAVALVQGVIDKADPEAVELHAKAYNVMGMAYRKAGRTKDALMAFLHTDVLYFASREDHVVALRNLVDLWKELQKPDRASQAQEILNQQYKQGS